MKKKILFIILNLGCGGAQRVISTIANGISKEKYDVSFMTLGKKESDFFKLDSEVKRIDLDLYKPSASVSEAFRNNVSSIKTIREFVNRINPDLVISFLNRTNVRVLISLFNSAIPLVISERSDPTHNKIGKLWSLLRFISYHKTKVLVCLSKGVSDAFWYVPKKKKVVIYNPIEISDKVDDKYSFPFNKTRNYIITVGRLVEDKAQSHLIQAFSSIAEKYVNWDLLIFGEGQLRKKLTELVVSEGLSDRIYLPGETKNPIAEMKQSQMFVLTSLWEGFGNVIVEAMSAGIPVISTDCESGPSEIIDHGKTGLLVPVGNIEKIAKAMEKLISNKESRTSLARAASQELNRFDKDSIIKQWEELFDSSIKYQ